MAGHWFNYGVWCLHFLGAVCWFCALFLHEDEEGKIQSRIEEWWIKVSDAQGAALSFAGTVARMTEIVFDRVFGNKLISFRLAGVSIYFSIASFFLFAAIAPTVARPHAAPLGSAVLGFLLFAAIGLIPAIPGKDLPLKYWVAAPCVLLVLRASPFLVFLCRIRGYALVARGVVYVLVCFGTSFLFDLAYIGTTRWMLGRISTRNRIYEIPLLVVGNIILLAMLVAAPVEMGAKIFRYAPQIGVVVTLSFILNTLNFLVGSVTLLLAILLLIHRLLWPSLERSLYAVQRFAPIKNKKFLWIAGGILISVPTTPTIEWARSLAEKLSP